LVHEECPSVIESLEDGLHPYLTGSPGTGKSRMVATIAKAFGFAPERTHFFPVSNMDQKNSVQGFIRPTDGVFQPGPGYHAYKGDLVFFDELDAGNGSAMNALNVLLDSPFVTFPNGETLERPEHLFIIGAGNTVGKGGDMMFLRNQMDAATRNRWVFHHVDYDRNIERAVVTAILGDLADRWLNFCWGVRERLEGERVVFSTRNIRHGALQVRRGHTIESIVASALLPGESDDIVRKSGALNWA
jgi:cobaltochelatase CobS